MKTSETNTKIWSAFVAAQGAIKGIEKTGTNTHLKNSYAKIEDILIEVVGKCASFGIALTQYVDGDFLMTRITHGESGEYIEVSYPLLVAKRDAQGFAGATTYARRYSLLSLFGLHDGRSDDDDGNSAVDPADLAARARGAKKAHAPLAEAIGAKDEEPEEILSEDNMANLIAQFVAFETREEGLARFKELRGKLSGAQQITLTSIMTEKFNKDGTRK